MSIKNTIFRRLFFAPRFGLQLAAASGANVIATSSSDDKLEVAKKLGASYVINYKKTPDWETEVLRIVRCACVLSP